MSGGTALKAKTIAAMPLSEASYDMEAGEFSSKPRDQYQLSLEKIRSIENELDRKSIWDLIQTLFSKSIDWEAKEIIKNTLMSNGYLITKREDSLNKVVG